MEFLDSVLIIGGGGREHALLKALLRSDHALCTYAYPGNTGMEDDGCMIVETPIGSWEDLADWAVENQIDLTVVGPEVPLVEGIVDIFRNAGLAVFGPTKAAARIEGSKAFAKNLMRKYAIPTAAFEVFTDKKAALDYLASHGAPLVVKASGLAAGKGAIVCNTEGEVRGALALLFDDNAFGEAGKTVILEEKMAGEEASVFILTDGKEYRILPVAQDHKQIFDGDTGPNTGGMGAYAPAPLVDAAMLARIEKEVVVPVLDAMAREGCPYTGLLYAGIMITPDGPSVVEFNCRFGDPETQAVLPLVQCDWFDILRSCTNGTLSSVKWQARDEYCVTVVLASAGYPGAYEKNKKITGIEAAEYNKSNIDVYHAGISRFVDKELVTSGGRVLAVSAWARTLEEAIAAAYEAASCITFEGCYFRRDIGMKGLARLKRH